MNKEKRLRLFPKYSDFLLIFATFFLIFFGSIMVVSAEMGESSGDLSVISSALIKQLIYIVAGGIGMFVLANVRVTKLRRQYIKILYFIILGMLFSTRLFKPAGGAYGWIRLGSFSIQPSEFAKLFTIIMGASLLSSDHKEDNCKYLAKYICVFMSFVLVVYLVQNDFGSASVIGIIGYCICLVPSYREIVKFQAGMKVVILIVLAVSVLTLSPIGTAILSKMGNHYQIMRFLASANPFAYQYDSGYHLVMSLVSFATGGWFGLGYGKSIHKFMNFPNPSTDFILPVVVEELGIVFGLMPIVIAYLIIFFSLVTHSLKCENLRGKIVLFGTFIYFAVHFILNIGGVSGFIPLTGVPLLLISAGGSAIMSVMSCVGLATCEIANYRKMRVEKR